MNDTKLKTLITCVLLCLVLMIGGSTASYFIGYRHGAISVQKQIDTIRVHDTLTIEKPQLVKEIYLRIPAKVDTAAILASQFTERIYRDTVKVPDVMTVVMTDTLRENILTGRDFIYDIHLPTFRPKHAFSPFLMCSKPLLPEIAHINLPFRWKKPFLFSKAWRRRYFPIP